MKCYNIIFFIFITIIGRIMLYKKTFFFVVLFVVFWGGVIQVVDVVVVVSFKFVGFIVFVIVDGVIEIEVLFFDGVLEYDYLLRLSDVKRLQNADLVVWVGSEMEAFM